MMTENEKKVLRLLLFAFDKIYSINEIAKSCSIAPNGAYKILGKFEKEGVLKRDTMANIVSYTIDFSDKRTMPLLELSLIKKPGKNIKARIEDLEGLRHIADACIIFGSYLKSKAPRDIDILFFIKKERFRNYKDALPEIKAILPLKLHDVLQTREDLSGNITKKDPVIIRSLQEGFVLWGEKDIIEVIKDTKKIR